MWLALKLLASGAADWVLRGISAVLKWLLADWRNAVVGTVLPGFFWMTLVVAPGLRADLAASEKLVEDTQLAHLGTITNFIDASKAAQDAAEANAARVKAEQEKITDATLADLRSDHAALRLRFDRLRTRDAAGADPRRADAAGLPGPGQAPGRAVGAPGDQDLRTARELTLCPRGFVCLTIDQAQRASEDAHRHDRLIDWVIGQSAVRFTPEESAE